MASQGKSWQMRSYGDAIASQRKSLPVIPSHAIYHKCRHMLIPLQVITCHCQSWQVMASHMIWQVIAFGIIGDQWGSLGINGDQWGSLGINGDHWESMGIIGFIGIIGTIGIIVIIGIIGMIEMIGDHSGSFRIM